MVINLPVFIFSESVHVGVKKNDQEGKEKIEYEPNIHHLDVAGGGKAAGCADKHGRQHQHSGQVNGHYSLEEKVFEKICCITDDIE